VEAIKEKSGRALFIHSFVGECEDLWKYNPQGATLLHDRFTSMNLALFRFGDLMDRDPKALVKNFSEAVESWPQNADAYYNLGLAYVALDEARRAEMSFERALELEPLNKQALYNRALLRVQFGDTDGALADYGLTSSPSGCSDHPGSKRMRDASNFAKWGMGKLLARMSRHEEAIAHYDVSERTFAIGSVWRRIPTMELYADRGRSKALLGDLSGAVADLRKGAELAAEYLRHRPVYNRTTWTSYRQIGTFTESQASPVLRSLTTAAMLFDPDLANRSQI
jgi:tetratricopeptide (TPR) repeat protein